MVVLAGDKAHVRMRLAIFRAGGRVIPLETEGTEVACLIPVVWKLLMVKGGKEWLHRSWGGFPELFQVEAPIKASTSDEIDSRRGTGIVGPVCVCWSMGNITS